ncbi:MAG: hypothetical protein OHK0029_07590 [Armatimonadaceae bacterium]
MLSRRSFLVTSAKAGVLTATFAAAGCGSGSNNDNGETINTPFNGRLEDVAFTDPFAGAVFIPRSSSFNISWPFADPPRQFSVFLRRFLEPIGGERFETPNQRIEIRQVDARTWNIRRRDNFDLDPGAVYFLELTSSGGQLVRSVFITSGNRAITENPGTGGSLNNLNIRPTPGAFGIPRNVGRDGFELQWDPDFPPPSQFTVQLRRFKERRGSDNGGDAEQQINSQRIGDFVYLIRRNSNFQLDGLAAYYLEVDAPGQGAFRGAFTTAEF